MGLKQIFLVFLLAFFIVLTGCVDGENGETISEGDSIEVSSLNCYPVTDPNGDCSRITEFEDIVIEFEAENKGDSSVSVDFSSLENAEQPHEFIRSTVIQDRCPNLFSMSESSLEIRKVSAQEVQEHVVEGDNIETSFLDDENMVEIAPGERMEFKWDLKVVDEGLYSEFNCPLKLELLTEQSVTSTKEVDFVEDSGNTLNPAISTPGPVKLGIDAPSSWPVEEESFPVTVSGIDKGVGSINEGLRLEDTSLGDGQVIDCEYVGGENLEYLRLLRDGSGDTVEETFMCDHGLTETGSGFLSLTADYTYVYDVGSLDITVCAQGDSC